MTNSLSQLMQKDMILDACTLISLSATGQLPSILNCLPGEIYVSSFVEKVEVKYLFNPVTDESDIKIDLNSVKAQQLLKVTRPTPSEALDVLHFVSILTQKIPGKNTGEAVSGAIAKSRNWTMATDDKGAIEFFSEPLQKVGIVTTFDIVKYWIDAQALPWADIQQILHLIKVHARYGPPPKTHHLRAWWHSFKP